MIGHASPEQACAIADPACHDLALAVTQLEQQALGPELKRQFAALHGLLQHISHSSFDLPAVLAVLSVYAQALTGGEGAAIAIEQGDAIVCAARSGALSPPLGAQVLRESGLSSQCLRTLQLVHCQDAEADPRVDAAAFRQFGIRSVIAAPLAENGRAVGLVEAFAARPRAFGERECEVLRVLAGVAALGVRWSRAPAEPVVEEPPPAPPVVEEPPSALPEGAFSLPRELSPGRQWIVGMILAVSLSAALFGGMRALRHAAGSKPVVPVAPAPAVVSDVRYRSRPESTALEIGLSRPVKVEAGKLADSAGVYFELPDTRVRPGAALAYDFGDPRVGQVQIVQVAPDQARVALALKCDCTYSFVVSQATPSRLVIYVEAPRTQSGKARRKR